MIELSKLREALKLDAKRALEVETIRATVVAAWERETLRLWERRVGHVQVVKPDTDRSKNLWLELWPIETVTLVEERGPCDTAWEAVDAADFFVVVDNQLQRISTVWKTLVRVTYTGGYVAVPAVGAEPAQAKTPEDVRDALFTQAAFDMNRNTSDKLLVRSQAFEAGSTQYHDAAIHPKFERLAVAKRRRS